MQSEFDFGDLFTQAARHVLPAAHAKGLDLLFDHRGPCLQWRGDRAAAQQALDRIFRAAIDVLDDGFVLLTAQVSLLPSGATGVAVAAASSGHFAPWQVWRQVLARLKLQGENMNQDLLTAAPAVTRCPLTGGVLRFVLDEREGSLFSLEIELDTAQARLDDEAIDAAGARAWLIGAGPEARSLERRLQRLGWATRLFEGAARALAELQHRPDEYSRPALVIAVSEQGADLQALRPLATLLPLHTQVVLLTRPDAPRLQHDDRRVEILPSPLGPNELIELTRRAALAGDSVSGETRPAPLAFEHRRRALVVDDNAVNQMVATGMLQVLGFEVDTASDGVEAIDRCLQFAPDLVLMDLHMPGMDGLEATRRLRLLQREGAIPSFPILAATADTTSQDACAAAGMDGHLPKPLDLQGLEDQLKRLMAY